jgi:hypothetical protein
MSKISAFLGKLNYLKIIKFILIGLCVYLVSCFTLLYYAFDGLWEDQPYSSERILFKKSQIEIYLTWRCWGITGDHSEINISKASYLETFEKNEFGKSIIFKLQQDELFYKTNGNDTLLVYSNFSGKHDSLLFDSLNCKIILKKIDSTSDFKKYNIHKFNCNNYGYIWLGQ